MVFSPLEKIALGRATACKSQAMGKDGAFALERIMFRGEIACREICAEA